MRGLRAELGGLSRSASYALENEAYRNLPALLERTLGIKLSSRMIRTEIADEEINVLAFGSRLGNGREVVVVGEAKLQLDRRSGGEEEFERVVEQIRRKVEVIRNQHLIKRCSPSWSRTSRAPCTFSAQRNRGSRWSRALSGEACSTQVPGTSLRREHGQAYHLLPEAHRRRGI